MTATLTLGPLLFNWPADKVRDFYFRVADEAPYDTVYLGEVVCAKRIPFQQPYLPDVIERLQRGGKRIVLSTLALIMDKRDLGYVKAVAEMADDYTVEANDVSAVSLLKGKKFSVGPAVNLYNESTLHYFASQGASHATLPIELNADSLQQLARIRKEMTLEVQVFGRLPLAIASRCYHARTHRKHKDNCQYVCEQDYDGLTIDTLDNQSFLTVNGTQTLSYTYCALTSEITKIQEYGISHFRLSPHDTDMVAIAFAYQSFLHGTLGAAELMQLLKDYIPHAVFSNGFYHGQEGAKHIA